MHTPPCILTVDDQSMNVEILSTRLRLAGYEVLTATGGADAIATVRDRQPDLILLDIMMPDLDGFEVCRRLKADPTLSVIPILMLTAKTELQDIVTGFEAGADDYVTKPVDQEVLVARVAALLRIKARHDASHDKSTRLEREAVQLEAWANTLEDRLQDSITNLESMAHLKRFLSPEVVKRAMCLGDDGQDRIGDRQEVTVLSCALHGFEAFVATADPTVVFEMLQEYHQVLAPLMNASDGTLVQFSSAELQLMFNAAFCHDPIERAVQLGVSMSEPLASQCEKWRSGRYGLDGGIGIAHGEVTFGLVELESRLHYEAIGAVRHLASRLSLKAQGANVLVSQPVWDQIEKRFHADPAGQLVLNGYAGPIPFYEVKGEAEGL